MSRGQRALLTEKIMDVGNLAIAAFTFGSLLGEFNIYLSLLWISLFAGSYLLGMKLKNFEEE